MILKSIATIIKDYMGLSSQQVWLWNEKASLPTDSSISVALSMTNIRNIGSSQGHEYSIVAPETTASYKEVISMNVAANVVVDVMARNRDLILRHLEVIQAMKSTACKEAQIKDAFLIGESPLSVVDASGIDGAAIPYRFQLTFQVQFLHVTKKQILYYDTIQTCEVKTEA